MTTSPSLSSPLVQKMTSNEDLNSGESVSLPQVTTPSGDASRPPTIVAQSSPPRDVVRTTDSIDANRTYEHLQVMSDA